MRPTEPKPAQPPFVHLHVHSEYSLVDGALRIKDMLGQAQQLGHYAMAITDHANLFGAVDFYSEAVKRDIKPIIGAELFVDPTASTRKYCHQQETHLPRCFKALQLAATNIGYKHLVKTVSAGYLDSSDTELPVVRAARITALAEDQFFIESCHGSEFGFLVREAMRLSQGTVDFLNPGAAEPALSALSSYVEMRKSSHPEGKVYIELVRSFFPGEKAFLKELAKAAGHFDLPLVASANAHYLRDEDRMAHTILLGIKNELKLGQLKQRRQNIKAHLISNEEAEEYFKEWPEALASTLKIAEQCDVIFTFGKFYLPKITLGSASETTADSLIRLARQGLEQRISMLQEIYGPDFDGSKHEEYRQRLEHELKVIIDMGFPDYFLIVQDFINWAKEHDIPVGPGRGSGAGSLVAYALRITDLDPIPYNLIFERFLNPERVSMPDFDVDFCQDRRDEVIQYVVGKYGENQVAQITTFGKMLAKAVIRDVGRVLDMSYGKVDRIAKLIPNELGITLNDAIKREPRITEEANRDPMVKDMITYALRLEGLNRHTSVHAAGIVISDGPMEDYVPVYRAEEGGLITQFEMKNAEKVGLVKFDFLGLKTLTVIQKAVQIIAKTTGQQLDMAAIPLADNKVFELISQAKSVGIFQLESSGMQQLLLKLQPSSFEDIIALVALFRPGPLGSGMVDDFVERKHGRQEIEYALPQLEPILQDTYGTILYQEQVQKIAAVLANYSLGEADLLRRAMGKKKPEEMAKQKTRFIDGCKQNQIDESKAVSLFDMMAKFAEYGFNKSHSAAYGLVSYQTAYLKTHYTAEFLAASMTCDMDNTDKIIRYFQDCKQFKIRVLPPDLNFSELDFTVPKPSHLRFGLAAIKGIGRTPLEALIEERNAHGPFQTLTELANRLDLHKLGKKTLELLIQAGALDSFGFHRRSMLAALGELVRYSQNHHQAKSIGQMLLFEETVDRGMEADQFANLDARHPAGPEAANFWLQKEKKLLGVYVSSHPLKLYQEDVETFANATLSELPKLAGQSEIFCVGILVDYFERTTREGKRMMVLRIEDECHQIAPALFEDDFPDEMPALDTPIVCKFKVNKGFENVPARIRLVEFTTLEDFRKTKLNSAILRIKVDDSALQPKEVINKLGQVLGPGGTRLRLELHYPDAKVLFKGEKLNAEMTNDLLQRLIDMNGNCTIRLAY